MIGFQKNSSIRVDPTCVGENGSDVRSQTLGSPNLLVKNRQNCGSGNLQAYMLLNFEYTIYICRNSCFKI